MSGAPGYWMHETSGVLRPAVEALLQDRPLHIHHVMALRAYLRQWMNGYPWQPEIEAIDLRGRVDNLVDRKSINDWLDDALDIGIDPL